MSLNKSDLILEVKIEQELAYRRKVNPLAFFKHLPLQKKFKDDPAKRKGILGGNRELAYGTKVRMADGSSKPIEKIKIGDNVLSWDGTKSIPTRVTDIPYDDYSECYKVTTATGTEVIGSETHCFPIKYESNSNVLIKKMTVTEIGNKKYKCKRFVCSGHQHYNRSLALPFSGYLLGLYLGDGSYGQSPSCGYPRPNFTNTDNNLRNHFRREISTAYTEARCESYPSDKTRLYVTTPNGTKGQNRFANDLRLLGLGEKKSDTKFIPYRYKVSSVKERQDIVRGLIETDGCLDRYKVAIYSNSLRMLKDVADILISLGGRSKVYKDHEPDNENQRTGYKLQFSVGLLSEMGITDLGRKTPKHTVESVNRADLLIKSVEYEGKKKCRCLTVEHESHTFVLDNGIVTYNSGKTEEGSEYVISKCLAKPNQRWWADAESFNDSVNIQQRKIWDLCPKNRIKYGYYNEITGFTNRKLLFDNGSMIIFKSYDQGREKHQGEDLDGCLAKGTLVAMSDGSYRQIEDIVAGDKVISINSLKSRRHRANKVVWQRKTGTKDTIIIKYRGVKLQLTHDHRVFVSGKGWIEAKDIHVGDSVYFPAMPLHKPTTNIKEHEAYWLGCMIGDGYINAQRLQFTCLNDKFIAEAKEYLKGFGDIRVKKQGDRQYRITKNRSFKELFEKHKLVGTHAYNKFIPQDIFKSSDKIKQLFLRSLYSSDGWVCGSKVGYASTSKRLAYDVVLLLNTLGIKTNVQELPAKGNWKPQWHVFIGKSNDVIKFLDEIGIVRDKDKIDKVRKEAHRRMGILSSNNRSLKSRVNFSKLAVIKNIEDGGKVDVYDIKVERDENFFANGMCVHNCWNDEEPPFDIYREQNMRLLDRNGEMIITMTSLKGITDLIQDIFDDHDVIESEYAVGVKKELPRIIDKNGFKIYLFWTTENPYISQDRVLEDMKLMPADEVLCRIYGMPINLSGKIYMKFSKNVHVIPFDDAPLEECTIYNVLDPHDRKPWALGWYGVHKTGTIYCFEEYPNDNFNEMMFDDKTYDEYAKLIKATEENIYQICGQRVDNRRRIIDPNFGNKTVQLAERQGGQSKTTPVKELNKRGLRYRDGIDALQAGHMKVREYLYYEKKGDEIIVQPKLLYTDNCHNHIRHVSRYSRKDIIAGDGDTKDNVGVKEKYKDYCDLDRYLCMANPKHVGSGKEFKQETQKIY